MKNKKYVYLVRNNDYEHYFFSSKKKADEFCNKLNENITIEEGVDSINELDNDILFKVEKGVIS